MGIFDKAKDALGGHPEQTDAAIERAGDLIDQKTGDKYAGQVDRGQELAKERLADYLQPQPEPGRPAAD